MGREEEIGDEKREDGAAGGGGINWQPWAGHGSKVTGARLIIFVHKTRHIVSCSDGRTKQCEVALARFKSKWL
jgi:hypothetical protein